LQQRILDLLDPAGPDHTTTFEMPTPVSRYFTDLRLLANVICATWPVVRPLAVSTDLANELDAHGCVNPSWIWPTFVDRGWSLRRERSSTVYSAAGAMITVLRSCCRTWPR